MSGTSHCHAAARTPLQFPDAPRRQSAGRDLTPVPPPTLGITDQNIATLGLISTSGHRLHGPVKTIHLSAHDGVRHVVQILAGGTLGLPTTADQDKLVALPRAATTWPGPPVTFTTYKFLKTLGLHPRSGKHYREVRTWIDRLTATTIISERGVRVAGRWRYQRERVHIVTRAVSVGERLPDGQLAEENHLWFADWFHQNITSGHTLEIDLDWYLRLRHPLARTLALPLQLWLRASQARGHFAKRWESLAESAGLTCYRQRSKVVEKLGPALDELQRAGMISSWSVEATRSGDGLKVSVRHGKLIGLRAKAVEGHNPSVAGDPLTHDPELLDELVRRGVHRGPALRLLRSIPADQPVAEQVAWFDQLIGTRSGRSIQDPPAFLYGLIRDGQLQQAPPRTVSRFPAAPVGGQHHYQLLQAYSAYVEEAVDAHLESLSVGERERLLAEHLDRVLADTPLASRWSAVEQHLAARRSLVAYVSKTLPLRPLRDYLAEHGALPTEASS